MFYTITSKQNLVKYLDKRLNLSAHILWKLANEVCNLEATKVSYRKDNDKIFYCGNDGLSGWFSATYWLRKHYTQCACCGQWYKENLSGDFLSTSIVTVYLSYKGRSKDLHICSPCTLEHEKTVTQIDDTLTAVEDGLLSFSDAFYPLTHVKV